MSFRIPAKTWKYQRTQSTGKVKKEASYEQAVQQVSQRNENSRPQDRPLDVQEVPHQSKILTVIYHYF